MSRDLRAALDDEPDDDAPTWKPNVGDEIVGRVTRREQIPNKYKPERPTERLLLHDDDGEPHVVYANHVVLWNKIQKLNPQVGDRVAIRRLADDPDKGYKRYKLVLDRATDRAAADPDDDIAF